MYKKVIYEDENIRLLKIYEHLMTDKDGNFIPSYLALNDSLIISPSVPIPNGEVEIEYITKENKLKTQFIPNPLNTIDFNCKIMNKIILDTIDNENGMDTNTEKFKDIKSFAMYLKALNDLILNYIKELLGNERIQ